ncbi:MAG: 16S rRNA (adenine(1518)-N(6)/adenine(1519)-N(6))-dimethyltransferase RsmA [Bacillota bacterium]
MQSAKEIIKKHNFRMKKAFGQNFLTDEALLADIVEKAGITADDTVIEVGPGAGTLTREIAKVAKRVVCFEIDETLKPLHDDMLEGFDNVEVRFQDIMKVPKEDFEEFGKFKVVANLPYYITTPILMFFLEEVENVQSLSVMVQLEVAKRLVADSTQSDYGSISVSIDLECDASIVKMVGRENFFPPPKVDSAVVRIDVDRKKYNCDKVWTKKVVKSAFKMRRKMLTNNLTSDFPITKQQVEEILAEMGINEKIRGEKISTEQFIKLGEKLKLKIENF